MINQENRENHAQYDLNEALKVENLTLNDYEEICKRLKRKPNRTELGMFGVCGPNIVVIEIQNLYYLSFPLKVKMF